MSTPSPRMPQIERLDRKTGERPDVVPGVFPCFFPPAEFWNVTLVQQFEQMCSVSLDDSYQGIASAMPQHLERRSALAAGALTRISPDCIVANVTACFEMSAYAMAISASFFATLLLLDLHR